MEYGLKRGREVQRIKKKTSAHQEIYELGYGKPSGIEGRRTNDCVFCVGKLSINLTKGGAIFDDFISRGMSRVGSNRGGNSSVR